MAEKILVSGSLAYDHLYKFPGVFQDSLASARIGALSVAFGVTGKTIHLGGCAGNIVFNGKLFKKNFILLGIAGKDFGDYEEWLKKHNVDASCILREKNEYTSQAVIVTDKKGQQITFFHEGASSKSPLYRNEIKKTIKRLKNSLLFTLISPNNRDFMLATIDACRENRIPYLFDPGQAMPCFSGAELLHIVNDAFGVIMNEYEFTMLQKRIKMGASEILRLCPLIIVTLGEKGSRIYFGDGEIKVPAVKPKHIKDPTGCGDAYRAGFLAGIEGHFPNLSPKILEEAGKLGASIAARCIESDGTQNHSL